MMEIEEIVEGEESSEATSPDILSDPFGKENYRRMKALLKDRVSARRYEHSLGVAKTAKSLAKAYGYADAKKARMAGLVHDWDKGYVGDDARKRAVQVGAQVDPAVLESMPWLLHGPSGAMALRAEFPELGEEVFRAVERHTSGAVGMSELDMIVYVADLIEPTRTFQDVESVRALVGKGSLEDLFFASFKCVLSFLVEHDRSVHPATVEIWNHYAQRQPTSQKGRLSSNPDRNLTN